MNIASNQPNEGTEDDDTKQSDITLGDVGRAQSEEGLSGVRERYKDRL